jgi:integrase
VQSRDGKLYLEHRDADGTKRRQALDTDDFTQGKAKANELALALLDGAHAPLAALTLKTLFDKYERLELPKKTAAVQAHRKRARLLFERCWSAETKVTELGKRHWWKFIEQRRSGMLRPPGRKPRGAKGPATPKPRPAGERQIQYDLSFFRAVCNWAMTEDDSGKRLLEQNPFRGLRAPAETQPKRPLVNDLEYEALRESAAKFGPSVSLFLTLAHETGHRANAIRQLRWSDFNPETETLHWRAESDKTRFAHTVPLSDVASEALKAAQRDSGRIGDALIFPSSENDAEPISRHSVLNWWRRLEASSALTRVKGRGWHSLRRKFATELKRIDQPLVDIARLGGWKGPEILLRVYMQPDEQTMREALTKRSQLRRSSNRARTDSVNGQQEPARPETRSPRQPCRRARDIDLTTDGVGFEPTLGF